MNDKIKELMLEAGGQYSSGNQNDWPSWGLGDAGVEKFAELIVKECAEICEEMAAKCAGLPGDGALARDCAHWIRKDFGVEE